MQVGGGLAKIAKRMGESARSFAMNKFSYGIFAAALAAVALAAPAGAQPYGYGPGWMMGPGYGYGMMGGYGPGYMMQGYGGGYAMGPGMMYGYGPANEGNLNLSVDQVKNYLQHMIRNPNLKVGDVKEKDADTIVAEIVTKQGNALVQKLDFNRHSGFVQPEQ
jgi:hypothetical protein